MVIFEYFERILIRLVVADIQVSDRFFDFFPANCLFEVIMQR